MGCVDVSNPLVVERDIETVYLFPRRVEREIADLERRIGEAEHAARGDSRRAGEAMRLAEERDALTSDPAGVPGVVVVVVGAIPERREAALLDEHPPRKGDSVDAQVGYNRDSFRRALTYACLVSPEVSWEQFEVAADSWPPNHWQRVWNAVRVVNHGEVDLPKSSAVSVLRDQRASERQRRPGTE